MRLWLWFTLALGAAEQRLGLGFELLRLRWDADCVDEWSRDLEAQAHQARLDAELERLLRVEPAPDEGEST
ncbi:hypothetical protein ACFVIM_12630 [Streptomyces sp. NPDC057638]|uniref:hypothetical protein n=1 Tax=Streptomyces sp. NPDC057638 TaxID=3346190 RepID=UPI00368CDB63